MTLFRRVPEDDRQREVEDEFRFHLEERIEALEEKGFSREDARAEALARFGDLEAARRACTAMTPRRPVAARAAEWIGSWVRDVRFATRAFHRAPGFAASVVLTAALGIAANTAVFTILNALVLRPLPVSDARELVRIYTSDGSVKRGGSIYSTSSYGDFVAMRQAPSLLGAAAYAPVAVNVRRGTLAVRAEGRLVSEEFFRLLGVQPAVGRLLSTVDMNAATPGVVLSHRFWRTTFQADPGIVGSLLDVNGRRSTVAGVAAPSFVGIEPSHVDVYLPLNAQPGFDVDDAGFRVLKVVGRLAPGATPQRVEQDLQVVLGARARTLSATNTSRVVTVRAARSIFDADAAGAPVLPLSAFLFAVTGVLLLIAAVNITALLLARTLARQRELAVRLSLGASRARIFRQLFTESLILAIAAEALALGALALLPPAARFLSVPESVHFGIDLPVVIFASALTFFSSIGFAMMPALRGASRHGAAALRHSHGSAPLSRVRGQRALVVVQVALSILLLSTAGLLIQSLRRQRLVDPGFDPSNLIAAQFEGQEGFQTLEDEQAFAARRLPQVRALPGVRVVSVTNQLALAGEGARTLVDIPGYQPAPDEQMEIPFVTAGPDFCAAMGLRLIRGEELRAAAATSPTRGVLVNERMAQRYWGGRDPVGSLVRVGGGSAPLRVIGIFADARLRSLDAPAGPMFVVQNSSGSGSVILIRTVSDPAPMMIAVGRRLESTQDRFDLRQVRMMDEVIADSLTASRALAGAITLVSALAMLLAICGLYAVVNYLAVQRRREFGIRMALGAATGDVMRTVLFSGLRLAAIGSAVGLALTVAAGLAMRGLLFSLTPADAPTLALVTLLMASVALAACLVPALRATRTSPAMTLRAD